MKIASWNVNGVRSVARYGFVEWLGKEKPDVVCLQETKAHKEQLVADLINPHKYTSFWHSAQDKGYSGVSVYTTVEPLSVVEGIGVPGIDSEGRVLTIEYKNFYLVNSYFPNSSRDHSRLPYKLDFCEKIFKYLNKISKKKNVVICGDFNIAHKEIDLANPKTNTKNAGFLPEERSWMDSFLKKDFVDVFRHHSDEPGKYTWWSYRPGVRERNIGWRLDYFCVDSDFISKTKKMNHLTDVRGSDHCPIIMELKN